MFAYILRVRRLGIHAIYCFAFLLYLNHFSPFLNKPACCLIKCLSKYFMTTSPYKVRLWLPLVTMWPLACVQAGAGRLLSSALLPVSQELASGPHHCWAADRSPHSKLLITRKYFYETQRKYLWPQRNCPIVDIRMERSDEVIRIKTTTIMMSLVSGHSLATGHLPVDPTFVVSYMKTRGNYDP